MGVVIETAGEMSFLARGKLGARSRRLVGCFTLIRLVGQISPADGRSWRTRNGIAKAPVRGKLAEWNALTRDEQIARYREFFAHPDCNTFTDEIAEEIIAAAQTQAAARA